MRKRWIILGAVLAIGGAVISQLPLSMVAPKAEFAGKPLKYSGTIWKGQVFGTNAGTLNLETSLGRFFSGQNPVHVNGGPQGLSLQAEAGPGGLRALKVEGSMQSLALRDPRVGAVSGNFKLDVPDMKILKVCDYAEGTAWTDFLSQNAATFRWQGPAIEGPVRCEDGRIIVDMAGQDDVAEITAKVTIGLEGSYRADITAKINPSIEPFAGPSLTQSGFHKDGGLYKLTEQGTWL